MQISELMTERPTCCTPDMNLQEVAHAMAERDCGALPVVEDNDEREVIGIITDRDIVIRAVAQSRDPALVSAREAMTATPVSVKPTGTAQEAGDLMGTNQVRRLVVLDGGDSCIGIVAQSDLARHLPAQEVSNTLRRVSEPSAMTAAPSAAARNG